MNTYIPEIWDDIVFYYADKIILHKDSGCEIFISPADCMVSLHKISDILPTVTDLRKSKSVIDFYPNKKIIEGKILVSAGVLLFINDKLLLFQRDAKAEISPLKWTSPAGRADRDPLLTALKELHEEIIVLNTYTKQPIFITTPDLPYHKEIVDIYSNTLSNKGLNSHPSDWIVLSGKANSTLVPQTDTVTTHFGAQTINHTLFQNAKFFIFYNESTNTLELLLPLSISSDNLNDKISLKFIDGEYERKIKLISITELLQMSNSVLVSTMVNYKNYLISKALYY